MMMLRDFCDYVKEHIVDYLPDQYRAGEVTVAKVEKNNGLILHGLCIHRPDIHVAPNYYLEDSYDRYRMGDGLENVMEKVAVAYMKSDAESHSYAEIVNKVASYDSAKEYLVANVVNTWRNMDRFASIPHVEREDLSIIFKIVVGADEKHMASITVNNSMVERWGVSIDQIYSDAMENTKKIMPVKVSGMFDALKEMGDVPFDMNMLASLPADKQLYIITNQYKYNGAVSMFFDEPLAELAERLNSDLIVLPSSVEEVIAVSANMGSPEVLAEMVREINRDNVPPEEQLSDNIYYYDAEKHEIMLNEEHEKLLNVDHTSERFLNSIVAENADFRPQHRGR